MSGGDGTGYAFTTNTGSSSAISVSGSGAVTLVGAPLHTGTYDASGTVDDSDDSLNSNNDQLDWTYDLTVTPATTISQTSETSNSTTYYPLTLADWSTQLAASGPLGSADSFEETAETSGQPPEPSDWLTVTPGGSIQAKATVVPASSYTILGTDQDAYGDTGTWTYTLTVSPGPITQIAPLSDSMTPVDTESLADQLKTNGSDGGTLTFVTTTSSPDLSVSSGGLVTPVGAPLATGSYTVSGNVTDSSGDTGPWTYTLNVSAAMITQTAPMSGSTTPAQSSSFSDILATTGNIGSTSFTATSPPPGPGGGLKVSSSGTVSSTGTLAVGGYTISGTDTDSYGDTGTWSYSLTVTRGAITQTAPFLNSTTPTKSASFTNTLATTGQTGAVTFVTTTPAPGLSGGLKVSSAGVVTTTGALTAGAYSAAGTDSDTYGDTGTWSYSLKISATAITQIAPSAATTTTGKAFSGKLNVSGTHGTVTYTQTSGAPDLTVSASGKVTAPASLTAGTYKATGTVKDTSGDSGTWGLSLTVSATKLAQSPPSTATTTTGKAFTDQLEVSGAHGAVSYSQKSGAPDLTVSSSGKVSTKASLGSGTYRASGTVKDSAGDGGSWSFTLTVTAGKITQIAPTTASTPADKAFSGQLEVTGAHGTVTFTEAMGSPRVVVSSSGKVSAPANLVVGTYKASGTVKDSTGDTGTWSFTLTVTASEIEQIAPTTATTTPDKAFSGQLEISGAHGTVTFTQATGAPELTVSSSGKVSAPANLVAGIYKATGTMKDSSGDEGTWSFALTVGSTTIAQAAPTTAITTTGKAFTDQLALSGAHGKVTFAQTDGAPELTVSPSGKVSAQGNLPAETYKATGTAKDAAGDAGAWSFALTVTATRLVQSAPITATTTTGKAFSAQLVVSGAHEVVTYAESSGAPDLAVLSSGRVSARANLVAGTYKATGTERDSLGDTGNWRFAVTVVATKLLQAAPRTATTTTGNAFNGQLHVSGAHGAVTYAQSTGALVLEVSSSGKVATTASLAAGTYKATGVARDFLGDNGTWEFDLTVVATRLTQGAPDKATTTTGEAFTGQLQTAGAHGAVTYAQSAGGLDLKVSSSGQVSAAATLPAGTYRAAGTARDSLGDTGDWSFTLTVLATKLAQVAPLTASTKAGKAFTGQLQVSGGHGTVTYAQSTGSVDLKVSSSGKLSTAATLTAGTYKATGTARDRLGDTGDWSFTLTVVPSKLTQVAPDTAVNKVGKAFTAQLTVSGASGTVTYAQTTGAPHLKVSSSGKISAGAGLAAGTYKATGTAKDAYGDTGKWTFTLTVKGTKLTQVAPTTGTTTAGKAFTTKLVISGGRGTVTFAMSSTGTQILSVTPSGTILAPDIFTPGTYKITGIVKDSLGDEGTWSFVLIVEAAAPPPA